MSRLTIDTGVEGNSATGDSLRVAFEKVNTNFAELYAELGGDSLDAISFTNNTISTDITNANLILSGNGTGGVVIEDLEITGSTINTLTTNNNLTLNTNGTGKVVINGLSFPIADGTAGQVLKTDGAGNLSFTAVDPGTITIVGDDSTGTAVNIGETFKIAGAVGITTAVSGDTLTITGPDLSSYATTTYVDNKVSANNTLTIADDSSTTSSIDLDNTLQVIGSSNITTSISGSTLTITGPNLSSYLTNSTLTVVGDDSTGVTLNSGETIKITGAGSITTAVSGDTLTITGIGTGYLTFDDAAVRGTSDYQYTFNTDGYFTSSTSSESPNYFFVTYNSTNLNIAAGWTVVGANCDTTVSSTQYPVAGYPGVIKVTLTSPASGTSGFYPVVVSDPNRLKVQIQPNPGTSDKYTFATTGITFPDTTVQNTAARITVVGDDSTGVTLNAGETIKIAGTQNISTAISGDTLTITGPNLSSYLTAVPKIIDVNEISSSDSSAIQINDAVNISGELFTTTITLANGSVIKDLYDAGTPGSRSFYAGYRAGLSSTATYSVGIGQEAQYSGSGEGKVAIGSTAGQSNQSSYTVAIGNNSGSTNQGYGAIGIGGGAGNTGQGQGAVAIGFESAASSQGQYSIAIGQRAGQTNLASGAIVLNATGSALNQTTANSFTVKPIRNATADNNLFYDSSTGEITYGVGTITIVGDDSTGTAVNIGETFRIAGAGTVTTAVSGDTLTITGSSSPTLNVLKIDDGVHEKFQTKTDATGTVTHDCSAGHIFYHTSPDANWTANFTNLNLDSGYATAVSLMIVQGGTGYYPNAVEIGGVSQTINWQSNATPTPSTNRTDVVTFSILNNSGTYTIIGQLTGF